jgi:hypothetical protein
MADIGFFIGALAATLLLSRIILWLLKRWHGGYLRLVAAHTASLAAATLVGAVGMADGGPLAFGPAFRAYVLPQLVWLVIDAWRHHRALPEAQFRVPGPSGPAT